MLDRNIAPPVRDFTTLSMPPVTRIELDNGVVANIMNQGGQEVFNLTAVWRGGNAECQKYSVPNLTLQLMREGAGGMSGEEFSDTLEFNGARIGVSADSHYSTLRLYSLNSKAQAVIPLMAAMCHEPSLPESEFSTVRERRIHQAELMAQKVEAQSSRMSNKLMMGASHPLARYDIPGEIAGVAIDDIRSWHRRIFAPGNGNLELFLSGHIDDNLLTAVNKSFGQIATDSSATELNIKPFHCGSTEDRNYVAVEGALQSSVRITYPAPLRTNPDYIPLRMLVMALGGYFGSRLMSNIREDKGLTYGITSFLMGYPEGGIIGIESATDPSTVDALISETLKEVERLASGDFTQGEITRLQRHLMSGLASSLDTPFDMMDYYITAKLSHIPEGYFERQVETIQSLTPSLLGEMAQKYLNPHKPVIVVAGAR
ncbi:MAG: insulinase family protein [Bacteroides sp.]|nr:insulinase family protein [Bacteroides sp.]MCM1389706.1 insulinase family protein [Bacteroides sp.]